ncbi:MAG: AAA family ATPase [Thermoproteota archaeon]
MAEDERIKVAQEWAAREIEKDEQCEKMLEGFNPVPLLRLTENAPDREWLVEGLLPKRSLCILAGKAGVSKSFLAEKIAADLSSGNRVLDFFDNSNSHERVLLIDEENDLTTLKERVRLLGPGNFLNVDACVLTGFKLDAEESITALENILNANGYRLLVLDCWTDLIANVDENDAVEVNNVLQNLKKLAWEHNVAILLIHHLRKNSPYVVSEKDELRGSSVLLNKPDIVLLLEQDPQDPSRRVLKLLKNRFGQSKAYEILFETNGDSRLEIKIIGEAKMVEAEVSRCVAILMDFLENVGPGEYRLKQLKQAAEGFSKGTVGRAIAILCARGTVEKARRGVYVYKGAGAREVDQASLPKAQLYNIVGNGQSGETVPTPRKACRECFTVLKQQGRVRMSAQEPGGICEYCGKEANSRFKVWEVENS